MILPYFPAEKIGFSIAIWEIARGWSPWEDKKTGLGKLSMGMCGFYVTRYKNWLVLWNMAFMTFHILGMSWSQLTRSYFSEG